MAKLASKVVKQAESWIGCKESNGSHKKIIDVYNSHKPRAREYKLKYTDAWCAGTVSAVAIALGYEDIIPLEVSCPKMIELCKKMDIWHENENYVPDPGDIIFYDWDDNGKGDNKGSSDHVGIVQKVAGGYIYAIEGNYGNAVAVRKIKVNGKYIRGFALPKYDEEDSDSTPKKESSTSKSSSKELKEDGKWGKDTTKKTQKVIGTPQDSIVSGQLSSCKKYLPNCLTSSWKFANTGKGSTMVRAIQDLVGAEEDGFMGKDTVKAMQAFLKKKGFYTGEKDGIMGPLTVTAWQKYINSRL